MLLNTLECVCVRARAFAFVAAQWPTFVGPPNELPPSRRDYHRGVFVGCDGVSQRGGERLWLCHGNFHSLLGRRRGGGLQVKVARLVVSVVCFDIPLYRLWTGCSRLCRRHSVVPCLNPYEPPQGASKLGCLRAVLPLRATCLTWISAHHDNHQPVCCPG